MRPRPYSSAEWTSELQDEREIKGSLVVPAGAATVTKAKGIPGFTGVPKRVRLAFPPVASQQGFFVKGAPSNEGGTTDSRSSFHRMNAFFI